MEDVEVDVKVLKTKNRTSNGWSMLATAMLRNAVKEGDVDFFESEWSEIIHELANINNNISFHELKELTWKFHKNNEIDEFDIFDL